MKKYNDWNINRYLFIGEIICEWDKSNIAETIVLILPKPTTTKGPRQNIPEVSRITNKANKSAHQFNIDSSAVELVIGSKIYGVRKLFCKQLSACVKEVGSISEMTQQQENLPLCA